MTGRRSEKGGRRRQVTCEDFLNDVEATLDEVEQIIGHRAILLRTVIEVHGSVGALIPLVQNEESAEYFETLRAQGRLDFTFESLVLRHPDEFRSRVVGVAKWRLERSGSSASE